MTKLQVAIDRVSVEKARDIISELDSAGVLREDAGLIEVGTSLIKEYGVRGLDTLIEAACHTPLLADIKVCDEGVYEAELVCSAGFSYFTAMGTASRSTLDACYDVAERYGTTLMIDLLECSNEGVEKISDYTHAVYCLHTSVDAGGTVNPAGDIRAFQKQFPQIQHIGIAGGITEKQIRSIRETGVDIVVMGSAITKASDMLWACETYADMLKLE